MSEKFTESFEQFSSGLGTTDVLLYAGVALFLWYMFKDKMGGIKDFVMNLANNLGNRNSSPIIKPPVVSPVSVVSNVTEKEDIFFQLVSRWKELRDLAIRANCAEAVKAVDQMFPYLSPNSCKKIEGEVK